MMGFLFSSQVDGKEHTRKEDRAAFNKALIFTKMNEGTQQVLRFSRGFLEPEDVITCNSMFKGTFNLSRKKDQGEKRIIWPAPATPSKGCSFCRHGSNRTHSAHWWVHFLDPQTLLWVVASGDR